MFVENGQVTGRPTVVCFAVFSVHFVCFCLDIDDTPFGFCLLVVGDGGRVLLLCLVLRVNN